MKIYTLLGDMMQIAKLVKKHFCFHRFMYDKREMIGTKYVCSKCGRTKHVRYTSSWYELKRRETDGYFID